MGGGRAMGEGARPRLRVMNRSGRRGSGGERRPAWEDWRDGVSGLIGTNWPRPDIQYLLGSISESLHGGVVVPPTPGDPAGCLAWECVRQG